MEPSPDASAFTLPRVDLTAEAPEDALVLTATNRLARQLRGELDARRVAAGAQVWESHRVMPWTAWLSLAHDELVDLGWSRELLLSRTQEHLVWQDVIDRSPAGKALLRRGPAATTAAAAYRLLLEWELPRAEVRSYATPEAESFLAWTETFEQRCAEHRWLARAGLTDRLKLAFAAGSLPLPGRLVLAGFDEYTPAQRALLRTLQAAGTRLEACADRSSGATPVRVAVTDPQAELAAVARWARALLLARPQVRIGVVVPDLASRRTAIADAFTRVLRPEAFAPDAARHEAPFEFSLGLPLADYPVVHDALLALDLASGERPLAEVSRLLRSPFLAGGEREWAARGALDVRLHEDRRPTARLARVLGTAQRTARDSARSCPRWTAALERFGALANAGPRRAAPSAWASHLDELLSALGWPGERPLDSAEYQTVQRFRELLAEFAATDRFAGARTRSEALALLRSLAKDTLFQPEGADAPIQVLGVLEAGGLNFDALWVLGLDDEHWPPAATPNPLLPTVLQRRHGLPHASSERELHFARRLLERLLDSAAEVVVSHPCRDEDRLLRPSPLVADMAAREPSVPAAIDPWQAAPPTPLERVADATAPPPAAGLRGGAQLLTAQALCPFSALATYRLRATVLENPCHAPDGRIVGQLVHRALEHLWRRLSDSANLRALAPAERIPLAAEAATEAVSEAARERPDLFGVQLQQLERERLTGLLLDWLALEEARAPFRVEQLEAREAVALAGLELHIRGDRVDRLEDGRRVVIDYKTGRDAATASWTGERPTEPQVPLYSVASGAPVAAALIGRVRTGHLAWLGLAEDDGLVPRIGAFEGVEPDIPDWPALLVHWRTALGALAAEIRSGRALATPSPAACTYCPYPPLCRLADAEGLPDTDADDAG